MGEARQHWRKMIDSNSKVFTSADLHDIGGGSDVTFRIAGTKGGELENPEMGKPKRTVMVTLAGVAKPWGLNITNAKSLEKLNGSPYPSDWTGSLCTLYITTTKNRGEEVECVRVRPRKPGKDAAVYGSASGSGTPFDLDGHCSEIAACKTADELRAKRDELNGLAIPSTAKPALKTAISDAEKRIAGGAA